MNETSHPGPLTGTTAGPTPQQVIEMDLRGLEPPQPLMEILQATATLPDGVAIRAHTRWRPMMLYPELEKRGFIAESQDQSDGSCLTHIRRR